MRRALLLAVLLCTVGCDDPTVHQYFVSNFVCTYMPWWMGDCNDTAVVAKAESVLEHGITAAHAECSVYTPMSETGFYYMSYRASLLQDGSCFASMEASIGLPFQPGRFVGSGFTPRGALMTCAVESQSGPNTTIFMSGGAIAADSVSMTWDVDTYCTGFNLGAFEELP